MKNRYDYETPLGRICIEENGQGLTGLYFCGEALKETAEETPKETTKETPLLKEAYRQLMEYFDGKRRNFDLPLAAEGTPFQKKVWEALRTIPYGETKSYGEIAAQVGNPKASRAVGGANHKNPIMIIVPCHRVIGANGALVGFGGGLSVKEYLLKLEKGGSCA